jgi:peptidoglycan/xylan/chitin deacetylase (PgdA/CDA1 family)
VPTQASLVVLACHRVGIPPQTARYRRHFVTPAFLAFQVRLLRVAGYTFCTLRDALDRPGRRAVVTFDDGYRDNYEAGRPVLRALGVPATVFVVSADIGKTSVRWRESGDPLSGDLMGWPELHDLAQHGWEIGSHGHEHIHFDRHQPDRQREVIEAGYAAVTGHLGESPVSFSYPYGVCTDVAAAAVAATGFRCAVTTETGPNNGALVDRYRLRRISGGGRHFRHYARALSLLLQPWRAGRRER